jgi:hypothetical protein
LKVRLQSIAKTLSAAREYETASATYEDGRANRHGQPSQGCADRRLSEVEAAGCLGDAAGLGYDREHAEEVEVEVPSISGGHVVHTS